MIQALSIFLLFFTTTALGMFSEFIHITPETRNKFDMPVCVTSATEAPSAKKIVFQLLRGSEIEKHAWLIVTREYLYPKNQNFRSYIWESPKFDSNVEVHVKINNLENEDKAEVIISEYLMDRAYIYIDFPHAIFDGGYYYSIDLSTFKDIDDGEC